MTKNESAFSQRIDEETKKLQKTAIEKFQAALAIDTDLAFHLLEETLEILRENAKAAIIQAVSERDAKIEIKAKIEALDKLIKGAGEYHDDPYEYVVPLRDIQEYLSDLKRFDLSKPVFKLHKIIGDSPATLDGGDHETHSLATR